MSEIWSCDPRNIDAELRLVAEKGLPVSLQSKARHLASARLRQIVAHGIDMYLILSKRNAGELDEELTRVDHMVYKFDNRPFVYFPTAITRMTDRLLACRLPSCLFFLQRRRHTRFFVRKSGLALFFLADRPRLCSMTLADISMGGARLTGVPRYDLDIDRTIGPATFSILAEDGRTVKEVTVSSARIVRNTLMTRDGWDIGLRFVLDDREKRLLAHLLTDPAGHTIFHWQPRNTPNGRSAPASG
ncbi:MAG: PilZ domain-containing protein [Thermodesulfobacteriota bacterium]